MLLLWPPNHVIARRYVFAMFLYLFFLEARSQRWYTVFSSNLYRIIKLWCNLLMFCICWNSDGDGGPSAGAFYTKICNFRSIYSSLFESKISEMQHCSFVRSLEQGYIMVQFNNAVLNWWKFLLRYPQLWHFMYKNYEFSINTN